MFKKRLFFKFFLLSRLSISTSTTTTTKAKALLLNPEEPSGVLNSDDATPVKASVTAVSGAADADLTDGAFEKVPLNGVYCRGEACQYLFFSRLLLWKKTLLV